MLKSIIILAFSVLVFCLEIANTQIVNRNVDRSIDLTSQLVKITSTITFENTGKDIIRIYSILLDPKQSGTLSYISVQDSKQEELKLIKIKQNNLEGFNIQLKQSVASGRTFQLKVEEIYIKGLQPYPSSITQKEKQLVRYFGNHYFFTPYITDKQITTITLNSRNIESYTKLKPVSQTDQTIVYGPYVSIPSYSEDEMIVHYENNAPFLSINRLERLIEVSHWGNIAVEENIDIFHSGSKLKGPFSRYDYQRDTSSSHHSIKSYKTVLPSTAYGIYYRDSNGNISTSQVKHRKDWIELELRPRFPLFGGWKSSYTLGYNIPSYQYLFRKSPNEFILILRLMDHVFDDMVVDELDVSIVLPVGVSNVNIKTPYEIERLVDGITHKYLDNLGRMVIKFRKINLVEQHIQNIEITYNWRSLLLFHEPLLLTIALYVMFIFVIIYVRLDFSIHKQDHTKKE